MNCCWVHSMTNIRQAQQCLTILGPLNDLHTTSSTMPNVEFDIGFFDGMKTKTVTEGMKWRPSIQVNVAHSMHTTEALTGAQATLAAAATATVAPPPTLSSGALSNPEFWPFQLAFPLKILRHIIIFRPILHFFNVITYNKINQQPLCISTYHDLKRI